MLHFIFHIFNPEKSKWEKIIKNEKSTEPFTMPEPGRIIRFWNKIEKFILPSFFTIALLFFMYWLLK